MNDKLKEFAGKTFAQIVPVKVKPVMVREVRLISLSRDEKSHLIMSLHPRIVQAAGWPLGELISFAVMGDGGGMFLFPDPVGGRALGRVGKLVEGRTNRKRLAYKVPEDLLSFIPMGTCREVEVKDGKVAFLFPEEEAGVSHG